MLLSEFAAQILNNGDLAHKMLDVEEITFDDFSPQSLIFAPAREASIAMSEFSDRFPKGHFHLKEKKALALHSFANHELLAVEMMAAALVIYPHHTPELIRFKKGVLSALRDEQKHFKLYVQQLNQLGYEFGDFKLNNFFWKQMKNLKTPSQYLATMSLTFEAANLDFAFEYKKIFEQLEDFETAKILNTVLEDEISHVGLGVHFLNKWREDKSLVDYYQSLLPWPMTPARSKGKHFQPDLRSRAHFNDDFIKWLSDYQDDFNVTNRREWKH